MKRRLLSIFCALCLCLTLLPTAALADGLETGTPTLLNGEGETDYATPSEEDGWTQLGDGRWFLVAKKPMISRSVRRTPFRSTAMQL